MKTIELTDEEFEWLKNTCIEKLILSEQLLEIHEISFVKKDLKMSKLILEKLHENSTHLNNEKIEKKFELTEEEVNLVKVVCQCQYDEILDAYCLEEDIDCSEDKRALDLFDNLLNRIRQWQKR